MAMARAAVPKWAVQGTTMDHIVGDFIMRTRVKCSDISVVYLAPNGWDVPQAGCKWRASMWTTGQTVETAFGGAAATSDRAHQNRVLYMLAKHFAGIRFR
ncbi:hypothetical protein JG688_00016963 [Phytophthora aleatoria]|uniref:Uncharacterized protein n=1 Tax=Phytophthora aleatoria TaxID=2496075 RepID=A0A8J5MC30_9STRA|nr:hypothetical protein JG688_00016963 [Phytophthora aleatoria]